MNNNMLPILILFGLLVWLVMGGAEISPVKPKLVKSTTTRKDYET